MKCTDKERQTCNVEKMGCEGCYYNEDNDRDIEELKTLFYSDKLTQYGKRKFIEYYEHLIKAYKELEEENMQLEAIKDEAIRRYNFESIPVSLVEEKIEELKNESYQISLNSEVAFDSGIMKNNLKIQVLQELLEKR